MQQREVRAGTRGTSRFGDGSGAQGNAVAMQLTRIMYAVDAIAQRRRSGGGVVVRGFFTTRDGGWLSM